MVLVSSQHRPAMAGVPGAAISEHTIASHIGASILEDGGNAIDAAVATTFAIGVLCPYHSCVGGGGFALLRTPEGEFESLNFRHKAPAAVTMEWITDKSTAVGGAAVAVPGQVAGMWALHQRGGVLKWADVLRPAIDLARNGMAMGKDLYDFLQLECPNAPSIVGSWLADDPEFVKAFTRNGNLVPVADKWTRPGYAATLQALARGGPDEFYEGELAAKVVQAVQAKGGLMTLEDLKDYKVLWNKPISGSYRGYTVVTTPAPASGAVLLSALGTMDHFPLNSPNTADDLHVTTEALRLAYGARTALGDPDFVPGMDALQESMVSPESGAERARRLDMSKTCPPEYYTPGVSVKDDNGTSNITTADADGRVVTLTTTIGLIFASRIMVPGTGIMLNDSMDDFSVAGKANGTGYAPAPANYVMGSKRPLSSSCPYIITRNGAPAFAGGAAGGSTIISANIQVIRNLIDYSMSASEATAAPRLHNQVRPDHSLLERPSWRGLAVKGFEDDVVADYENKGHMVEWTERNRSTPCAMRITDEGWDVAGDARKWDAGGAVNLA